MCEFKKLNKTGLIVIGYQGIGKTSIAREHIECIDLESSVFKIDGVRDPNWYVVYVRQAIRLAQQGYIVFVSSHKCVRDELAQYYARSYAILPIFPNTHLKDEWVKRLKKRYKNDPSEKNRIAWKDAKTNFDAEIVDLINDRRFDARLRIDGPNQSPHDIWKSIHNACDLFAIKIVTENPNDC